MRKFSFRAGEAAGSETLSPEAFLAKYFGGPEAFSTMEADLKEFAPKLNANLASCVDFVNRGYKVNSLIEQKDHLATNMPYVFLTMGLRNGNVPLMLLDEANIADFLRDYQEGKVKIDFSYQELLDFIKK